MFAAEAKTKVEMHAIERATQRLILRYAGRHDPEVVRQTVAQVTDLYAAAEVYAFVPVLIERDTRRILDEPDAQDASAGRGSAERPGRSGTFGPSTRGGSGVTMDA